MVFGLLQQLYKDGEIMAIARMKFIERIVTLHNRRQISILIPFDNKSNKITAADDDIGYNLILSDGSGYAFLSQLFAFAVTLNRNEVMYLPFGSWQSKALQNIFPHGFYIGMVIVNYCSTQITNKDIKLILKTKIYTETSLNKTCNIPKDHSEFWKSENRLTIKQHGLILIICANGDIFSNLAVSCIKLSEYGDDS